MIRTEEFKAQQGYFSFVQNSETDYLRLAYAQALSIKSTQHRVNNYCIAVDPETKKQITAEHMKVFDYVVDIPFGDDAADHKWKLQNAWKLYSCTPFKETVNLDCDMLFPNRDIAHWWDFMRKKEICITTGVRNFRGELTTNRNYRRVFDDNNLLNTYNGFSYFRHSQLSHSFFTAAKSIFQNWDTYRDKILKNCRIQNAATDEVYAIAADLVGRENCSLPYGPSFCHMKPAINGLRSEKWTDELSYTLTDDLDIIVGGYYQAVPFHYQLKEFITDDIIERYKEAIKRSDMEKS